LVEENSPFAFVAHVAGSTGGADVVRGRVGAHRGGEGAGGAEVVGRVDQWAGAALTRACLGAQSRVAEKARLAKLALVPGGVVGTVLKIKFSQVVFFINPHIDFVCVHTKKPSKMHNF